MSNWLKQIHAAEFRFLVHELLRLICTLVEVHD